MSTIENSHNHTYEPICEPLSQDEIEVSGILTDIKNSVVDNTSKPESVEKPNVSSDSSEYPLDPTSVKSISLINLIKHRIGAHVLQKKYELPIDAKHIYYIQLIIQKHPEFFDMFESSLNTIIKDGIVSFSDMPEIVKMMMKLYEILHKVHPQNISHTCSCIMKILCFICLKEDVVRVENKTDVLIAFNKLIDSIEDLLKMHVQLSNFCSYLPCNFTRWCCFN